MTRREMLGGIAVGGALLAGSGLGFPGSAAAAPAAGPITLPPLPWPETALQPLISARTIAFHHGKHHRAYVENLVKLVRGTPLAGVPLDAIVRRTAGRGEQTAIFNNAAQAWNHTFYWHSLKPKPAPAGGTLLRLLRRDLGGPDGAKRALVQAGAAQFGSGWAWLVADRGTLKVVKTANAETPHAAGQVPLLTLDVWEHAYYLDYQNRRPDYLQAVVDHLLDWDFAATNLAAVPK
jgi:Fe-Mn family superoxide dismutase